MPTYEYMCTDCKRKFDIFATLSQKEKGLKPACPKCQSSNTVQVFGSVMFISGSSESSTPICGPGAGPGCCG